MNSRAVVVLALIATALAALLYFKPGKKSAPEFPLSSLSRDNVKRLEIERAGNKRVVLERNDSQWRMTAPFAARVDAPQVDNVLSLLEAKSGVRYAQQDLARFDLEQPLVTLTINEQKVAFGAINPVSGEQYAGTEGHVYLVSPRYASAAQAETWASRKFLADDEQPVRFEFPSFTVAKSDEQWSLTPDSAQLSQDDFKVWLNRWRLATALSVMPADGTQGTQLKAVLAGGKEIPMAYFEKDSQFFFVRQDETLKYQFSPAVAKPLVEPPQPARDS